MARLTFYFDPACPWAWRTSLWVRELQRKQAVDVQWKLFSLAEVNRDKQIVQDEAPAERAHRTLALARRTGGQDAIERLYRALGHARFDRREDIKLRSVIEAALQEAGLDEGLLRRAEDDPSTDQEVLAEHREAVERFGAFGVPWLVLGDNDFGFYGPIISEVPREEKALELWEHASWMLSQPHFFELKRPR